MKRRGLSLNEALVSISLIAVLLPLCGKLLWTLAHGERAQLRLAEQQREFLRLNLQLKADALAAARFAPPAQFQRSTGETVNYAMTERGLTRTILQKGERRHGDTFYLGREARLEFEADAESQRVVAVITRPGPGGETSPTRLRLSIPFKTKPEATP
jgi:hypothetical protein